MPFNSRYTPTPVSTRLRTPRSPAVSRDHAWKRASTRPKRQTNRNNRPRYTEISEDEDDEEGPVGEVIGGDDCADNRSETSSSSHVLFSESDRQTSFSSRSNNEFDTSHSTMMSGQNKTTFIDLTVDDDDAPTVVSGGARKMKLKFSSTAKGQKQQTSLSFTVGKPMSANNSSRKKSLVLGKSPSVVGGSSTQKSFKDLAVETLQNITTFLGSDKDVISFGHTCRAAFASVNSSVWRERFSIRFDQTPELNTDAIARIHMERCRLMNSPPLFNLRSLGLSSKQELLAISIQEKFMILLRTLLLESCNSHEISADGEFLVQGKNHQVILGMLLSDHTSPGYIDVVDAIFCTHWDADVKLLEDWTNVHHKNNMVHLLQISLAPYYLGTKIQSSGLFEISQYHVYSNIHPIFLNCQKNVNARQLLHIVNFFQFHLKENDGLFVELYPDLRPEDLPRPCMGTIKAGVQPLGTHFKGIYATLSAPDLRKLRCWNGGKQLLIQDHHVECDAFQDISFFFDEENSLPWPKKWERILQTEFPNNPSTSSSDGFCPEIKEFYGTSRRGDSSTQNGHFFGRLQSMPPQEGVYGFQRFTLLKFDAVEINGVDTYDGNTVYAYEGCVFPGGTVIAGRWWNHKQDWQDEWSFSGPFLWWNVDSPLGDLIQPEEALEFLDTFHDQAFGLH